MTPENKQLCDQAFHRFCRSQPIEVIPGSSVFSFMKIAFEVGFSEGGKVGANQMAKTIREDLGKILEGER